MNPARPTLVMLPGNMCDAQLWRGLTDAIGTWPMAFPRLDASDTIAGMAAQVLAEVEGPIVPIGFSMGGIVALAIAATAPERLAGLALLDTNASDDHPERAAARPEQQEAVRGGALAEVVRDQLLPSYFARDNQDNSELNALVMAMAADLGADVFVRQSEALRTRADQRTVLPALACPIFLACGAEDRLCPPAWHADMAAAAPTAELHVIAGAGHMLPLENPGVLAPLLSGWLQKLDQTTARK